MKHRLACCGHPGLNFAFIVAAGASFTLYRLTSDTQPGLAPAPTVKLVLASRDLELGAIIREGPGIGCAPGYGRMSDRELLHFQSGCTVYVLALRVELEYLGGWWELKSFC